MGPRQYNAAEAVVSFQDGTEVQKYQILPNIISPNYIQHLTELRHDQTQEQETLQQYKEILALHLPIFSHIANVM